MITAAMTECELLNEIQTDFQTVFRVSDYRNNKWRRLVMAQRKFPLFACMPYTSPKKNRWLILLEARTRKEHGDKSRVTFICLRESPEGVYAYMIITVKYYTNTVLLTFPPHFFSRYAERNHVDKHGVELITHFFTLNNSFAFDYKGIEAFGSTTEGVCLGKRSESGNIMFITFITNDMTKGEQVTRAALLEECRKEMHG